MVNVIVMWRAHHGTCCTICVHGTSASVSVDSQSFGVRLDEFARYLVRSTNCLSFDDSNVRLLVVRGGRRTRHSSSTISLERAPHHLDLTTITNHHDLTLHLHPPSGAATDRSADSSTTPYEQIIVETEEDLTH